MSVKNIVRAVYKYVISVLMKSKYYRWHVSRKKMASYNMKKIYQNYRLRIDRPNYSTDKIYPKCVVMNFVGDFTQGGLSDRFRGIISVYKTCKDIGVQLKLNYVYPFNLEMFLLPNLYDWHINEDNVCYDVNKIDIISLYDMHHTEYECRKQEDYLKKRIKNISKQAHIYSNADYSYNYNFSDLFNELFKISPKLESSLKNIQDNIGGKYISISARFLDLLSDFNEYCHTGVELTKEERSELIRRNLEQVELLHEKYPDYKVLVNSDSVTFLEKAKSLPFVYVIPGEITHVGALHQEIGSYEKSEKTFLDFFMIAKAEKIFLIKTGQMLKSGFPYTASLIYNKSFEVIEF